MSHAPSHFHGFSRAHRKSLSNLSCSEIHTSAHPHITAGVLIVVLFLCCTMDQLSCLTCLCLLTTPFAANVGIVVESTNLEAEVLQTTHSCKRFWSIAITRSRTLLHVVGSSLTTSSAASAANARRLTWSGDFRSSWDKTKRGSSGHRIQRPLSLSCTPTQARCWNWMQNAVRPSWELSTMKPETFSTSRCFEGITYYNLDVGRWKHLAVLCSDDMTKCGAAVCSRTTCKKDTHWDWELDHVKSTSPRRTVLDELPRQLYLDAPRFKLFCDGARRSLPVNALAGRPSPKKGERR